MSNRKPLLIFFLFGLGLFLLGLGLGKNFEASKTQTLGEKSIPQTISPSPVQSQDSDGLTLQALVIKVIDGDTIDVEINGQKDVVRLIGINAPEANECFGKEATARASELLSSKQVSLESDPTQGERDKYRRLLRYVFVAGTNFEKLMVREGFAKEYTYNKAYKYQSLFRSAQNEAQDNKRGLWAEGACSHSSKNESKPSENVQKNVQGTYTCDCSKLCSQIATCDEAYYQLNQCGCTKRDSDKDGVPCESLCK